MTVVTLFAVLLLAGAWYFASQLTVPPPVRPFEVTNEVLAVEGDHLVLRRDGWAAIDGTWGLRLPNDRHVVLGEQQGVSDLGGGPDEVVWDWEALAGRAAPRRGDPVRVDEYVWVGTPAVVGLEFDEVTVEGPLGPLPSWWVPATGDEVGTIVFVHGWSATREEALRFLPALTGAGWNVLVQSWRGDEDAPPFPGGRVRFGTAEWEDVAAAVDHAAARTEGPIVPFGSSMGGSLVTQYLDATDDSRIAGAVLDSPILSMDALLDLQAGLNGVPEFLEPVLLPLVQLVADLRHGIDSPALEQTDDDGTFDLPVLLYHGNADDFVPVGPSQELAANVDSVTYVPIEEAGHVRSWNVDRARYEDALLAFLDRLAP